MKIIDYLNDILNKYSFSVYDKNNQLINFSPISDWEFKENTTHGYTAKINVKNEKTKQEYKISLYDILSENKDTHTNLSCYISTKAGNTVYSNTDSHIPENSILKITSDKIFSDLMKYIKPEDFKDFYNLIDSEELLDMSDDYMSIVVNSYILNESKFDKYITNKRKFISNRHISNYFSEAFLISIGLDDNIDENELENLFIELIDDNRQKEYYFSDQIDDFYDLESLIKFKNEFLTQYFTNYMINKWENNTISYSDELLDFINNKEKYKIYFLNNDELISMYKDLNPPTITIVDKYHGGEFEIEIIDIEAKFDDKKPYIKYNFLISVIIDIFTGNEYESNTVTGYFDIYKNIDNKITWNNENLPEEACKLDLSIILEELYRQNFKFLS